MHACVRAPVAGSSLVGTMIMQGCFADVAHTCHAHGRYRVLFNTLLDGAEDIEDGLVQKVCVLCVMCL